MSFQAMLKRAKARLQLEQSRIVITRGESRVEPDAPALSLGGLDQVRAERPFKPSLHRIDLYDCPAVALAKAIYNSQVEGGEVEEILAKHERTKDGALRKGWNKP